MLVCTCFSFLCQTSFSSLTKNKTVIYRNAVAVESFVHVGYTLSESDSRMERTPLPTSSTLLPFVLCCEHVDANVERCGGFFLLANCSSRPPPAVSLMETSCSGCASSLTEVATRCMRSCGRSGSSGSSGSEAPRDPDDVHSLTLKPRQSELVSNRFISACPENKFHPHWGFFFFLPLTKL